ncbi:MAG TPA: NAD-dependent epimerase/dehydratase family protein [Vicinamibacteria bacterium]|nr:NAD-dependent epimerase/dehydratase family protein [Vicinamibacteria bacterium]
MNVAVTGASGHLGTVVLKRLIDERPVKHLLSLDLRPPAAAAAKLRHVAADVRSPDLAGHLAGCDAVVHLAFIVTRHLPRREVEAVNVGGSRNVFEAAARAGVKRIVYTSSVAAYGVLPGHPVPIVEDTPRLHQPDFAYAATKHEVEAILDAFEEAQPGIAVVRLRPGIFVGGGMEHPLGRALRRGVFPILSDAPLPLVWDEDVAEAIVLALRSELRGAFNLVADEPLTARRLAELGGFRLLDPPRLLGRGLARLGAALARLGIGDGMDPAWVENAGAPLVVSAERARGVLGWRPRCPTSADVIRRFVETVPRRPDRRIALFMRAVGVGLGRMARTEGRRTFVRVHLALTGPGGGDWSIEIDQGRARVARGVLRPPTCVVTLSASDFLDLVAGRAHVVTSEMTGRVRLQGEPAGAWILEGMVASFREQAKERGLRGKVLRTMARWISRGAPA